MADQVPRGAGKVVVATHEVTRTGAPMSLLHLLRWLVANTDLELEVLVAGTERGDALLGDFEALAPTRVVPRLFSPGSRRQHVPDCSVLYLNSIYSAGCLRHLPRSRPYIISRVPELRMAFEQLLVSEGRNELLSESDHFIAVSGAVRTMLIDDYDVPADRISVVPGAVDLASVRPSTADEVAALRRSLGLGPDTFVIGGAGVTEWRKGPDLFVRVAQACEARLGDRPLQFLWIGGSPEGPEFWQMENRILARWTPPPVRFLGSVPNPWQYYALMDVFALTSREDPFPRVCMEAAAMGVPVVTFDNGGAVELVAKGCGFVVPYLDVDGMADRIVELLDDPDLRRRVGAEGERIVRRDHTVDAGGPATLAEIETGMRRVAALQGGKGPAG